MEYLYIYIYIILLSFAYIGGKSNTSHGCMEPFIRLSLLTEEACDDIDWCFIKTTSNTTDLVMRGCCKRCSCSDQCSLSHSCCPDVGLNDQLNGKIYNDVSEFVSVLRNMNSSSPESCTHEDTFSDRHIKRISEDQTNLTCSYSRLKQLDQWRVKSPMYAMVTSCSNENVAVEVKSKCESIYSLQANMHPADFLPVQSSTTGVVYRNKFCIICSNENLGHLIQWNMVIAIDVNPKSILYDVISSFHDIMKYITSVDMADVFFEPTTDLRRMRPPANCVIVDVNTCPSENGSYHSYEDTYTKEACETYTLPVYSYSSDEDKVKAYNNIACANCNNVLTQCSKFYKWGQYATSFVPFLGTLALSEDAYNTRSNHDTSDNKLGMSFSTNCDSGYAYDKTLLEELTFRRKKRSTEAASESEIPAYVNWKERGYVTSVKDQGDCGSCWAFGVVGSLEGQLYRKTGRTVSLSAQQLVDCDNISNGCDGGFPTMALKYITSAGGVMAEREYPYTAKEGPSCRYNLSMSVPGSQVTGHILLPANDELELKAAVARVGPIIASMDINPKDIMDYGKGVFYDPSCESKLELLDHSVVVVGYGSDPVNYWLVKNSMGPTWGEGGYIKVARNRDNQCGLATRALYPAAVGDSASSISVALLVIISGVLLSRLCNFIRA